MRQSVVWLLVVAVAMVIGSTAIAAAQGTKATIEFWTVALRPAFDDYINGMINTFQSTNPGITIKWEDVPFPAIEQRLLTSIAGGVAPDVVNLNQIMVQTVGARGGLVDLRQLVPQSELADYAPGLLAAYESPDGKLWALPWYSDSPVFYYNPDIMVRAGLDPKSPPRTMSELYDAIVTVYRKTGVQGYFPAADARRFVWALGKEGIPVLSKDGKRAVFNSPDAVALLSRVRELVSMGAIPRDMVGKDFSNQAVDLYSSGQLWMGEGATMLRLVRENNPQLYARTIVGPDIVGALGKPRISSGWALAITQQSKHKKEAAAWATFVTNTTNQVRFTELVPILPSRLSAAGQLSGATTATDPQSVAKELQRRQLTTGQVYELVLPDQGRLFDVLNEQITLAALGRKDPQKALDEAVQEWNRVLAGR